LSAQAARLPPPDKAAELARLRALMLRLTATHDAVRWAELAGAPAPKRPF
jgi:hypothetical protein